MFHNKLLSIGLVLIAQTFSSAAMALPKASTAVFDVTRNGMSVGYLKSSLSYSGQTYQYSKSTQSTGIAKLLTKAKLTEAAEGKFKGERLIPVSYTFNQSTRKKKVSDKTRFAGNMASGTYKGKAYSLQVPANILDRATLEMAVASDLALQKPTLQYNVMERGKLKQYVFVRAGNEQLETAAGVFNTVKVSVKRDDKSRETTYWMAKELSYLPVKMLHEEDGEVIGSLISRFTITP